LPSRRSPAWASGGGGLLVLWLTFRDGRGAANGTGRQHCVSTSARPQPRLSCILKDRKLPGRCHTDNCAIAGAAGAVGGCIVADMIEADLCCAGCSADFFSRSRARPCCCSKKAKTEWRRSNHLNAQYNNNENIDSLCRYICKISVKDLHQQLK
jgi:hypothetical protein